MITRRNPVTITIAKVNGVIDGLPINVTLSTGGYATEGYFRGTFLRNFQGTVKVEHTTSNTYNSYKENYALTHPEYNIKLQLYGYAFTENSSIYGSGAWELDMSFIVPKDTDINALVSQVIEELEAEYVRVYSETLKGKQGTLNIGTSKTTEPYFEIEPVDIAEQLMKTAKRIKVIPEKSTDKSDAGKVKRNGTSKRDNESEY
jgi:hypothetical protein